MSFVIQRTATGDPVSYWGRMEAWVARPKLLRFSQLTTPFIPAAAMRYERWEVASDVAEALRMKSTEHGEVIAVITDPEQVHAE